MWDETCTGANVFGKQSAPIAVPFRIITGFLGEELLFLNAFEITKPTFVRKKGTFAPDTVSYQAIVLKAVWYLCKNR